jgi:succinate dehydrogenase / fumarate reductase, iron-sulfur subunit
MEITFKIRRYDPDRPGKDKPYWEEFVLGDVDPKDRVVELMNRVKWEQDGTLTFRRSCSGGICGSDAVRINGQNMLACKVLVRDVADKKDRIMIEPILGLPVIKDLVVDMEPFFAHYRAVMPYFVTNAPIPEDGLERLQTAEDREIFDNTTSCILCACCTTSCPSFWANVEYTGPAAIVQAHRFIFDSRDDAAQERLNILAEENGVWRCRTIYNCTPACPREIEVTRAIGEVKLAIQRRSTKGIIDPNHLAGHHEED